MANLTVHHQRTQSHSDSYNVVATGGATIVSHGPGCSWPSRCSDVDAVGHQVGRGTSASWRTMTVAVVAGRLRGRPGAGWSSLTARHPQTTADKRARKGYRSATPRTPEAVCGTPG